MDAIYLFVWHVLHELAARTMGILHGIRGTSVTITVAIKERLVIHLYLP
jgi:hypothetical protein